MTMTDYVEEQTNEIEALEAIYPNEFEVIEVTPFHQFTIFVKTEDYEDDTENGAALKLQFTYVSNYPDSPPLIDIKDNVNIEDEDMSVLKTTLNDEAENNVGMVMIFTLVSAAQEWLHARLHDLNVQRQEEEEQTKLETEMAESKKHIEGTPVTVESFLAWKAQFDSEIIVLKKTSSKDDNSRKLTGRELFERDHTLNESDIQFILEGEEEVTVDESLFQEYGDLM